MPEDPIELEGAPELPSRVSTRPIFKGSVMAVTGEIHDRRSARLIKAVRSLARSFSAELLPRGIRVNALSPGPIETPIFGRMGLPPEAMDGIAAQMTEMIPIKRFGKPEEMAKAALFLASSDSSYVVGSELVADGGLSQL